MRAQSLDRRYPISQTLVGWGLLVEAVVWAGLSVWTAWGWRQLGAPTSFTVQSLAWITPALPIALSGLVLLRDRREAGSRAAVIACLALTLLVNLGLSVLTLLDGALGIGLASSSRALSLAVGTVAALLVVGVTHAIRERKRNPVDHAASDRAR